MVVKKKKIKVSGEALDNLYISMHSPKDKRKNVLLSIKNSLIMQDEYEKITKIRKEKIEVLNEIKKELSAINSDYQALRKILPNVKNVLTYTEKELDELNLSIDTLKSDIKSDNEEIDLDKNLENSIIGGRKGLANKISVVKKEEKTIKKEVVEKKPKKIKSNKLDRIRQNLKIIESKLNSM